MSKILIINAGSSSIKFQILQKRGWKVLCKGVVERIGLKNQYFCMKYESIEIEEEYKNLKSHFTSIEFIFQQLITHGILKNLDEIHAIGHRVVHGGEYYSDAVKINARVLKRLKDLCQLAPLHNPHNIEGIIACQKLLPQKPNIAVFDTAFHNTIDEATFLYAIPYEFYKKNKIRRYGFHGTSHKYVSAQVAKILKNKRLKIISCHLGNGQSVTAIKNGKSVDTSMGFTPLEGLMMGTRSGDIDAGVIFHLLNQKGMTSATLYQILNKESGLLGIYKKSSDLRDIYAAMNKKDHKALLAFDMMVKRIAKYIGSYATVLGGVDVIVFTGGIGEHAGYVRKKVCDALTHLGVKLDQTKNRADDECVHLAQSDVKIMVIPTNEELQIAKETAALLK
jgi:acetate kinase